MDSGNIFDLIIIGGGINGAAIARDAAGRGLSVALVERGDFGSGTSSTSTELLHGGLRYLEFGDFRLVSRALSERGRIFNAAPHITHPLSFVLPCTPHGRPSWLIRLGLVLYDHLGNRGGMAASEKVMLRQDTAGRGLDPTLTTGWRYWDGWVDDARMVVALLRDAADHGAYLFHHNAMTNADHADGLWRCTLADGSALSGRFLVNAAGPWAGEVARDVMNMEDAPALRLVRGSHILVRRMTSRSDALVLQQSDKRIVFMVPVADQYLMIGTTEVDVESPADSKPDEAECAYLIDAANAVLSRPVEMSDICHSFGGVRPLLVEPGKNARETSREWRLHRHSNRAAITVIGGKITTHRLLAEALVSRVVRRSRPWTAKAILPGADFEPLRGENNRSAFDRWLDNLPGRFRYYDPAIIRRFGRRFGRDAEAMLENGIGPMIGGLFEAELEHFVTREWASCAEDILWRRTKVGLDAPPGAAAEIDDWIRQRLAESPCKAGE